MKTLVIHPFDRSTHFLREIYEDIPHKTVITGGYTIAEIENLILAHNRIIMLGHGSPNGLFSVGQFGGSNGYIVDFKTAELLRDKQNIYIWCHANQFVEKHNLKGFCSGMFVSEVGEALVYGLKGDKRLIEESNNTFAFMLGSVINKPMNEAYEQLKSEYGWLAGRNEIAKYNHERLMLAE